ncbi:MAG: triose-phosphate isomerase [Chitinophagaceae bacterium]|nr:triose-phosphate isomerase [Chitinophagaceae bacterium]
MRKQIAAANWKMNGNYQQAEKLLNDILSANVILQDHQQAIFSVPSPFLIMAKTEVGEEGGYDVAAQNCFNKASGAFTGEVSVEMLHSIGINYCIVGHSERREYFAESNAMLAEKVNLCLQSSITPIFCCGEPLNIREANTQNDYVAKQLAESLFHLSDRDVQRIIIAYEPIWAIGTGKTATSLQAQEMHAHLRSVLAGKFGAEVANNISILYGGSVKANNAVEIFSQPDVDGGLVGGASLNAEEFLTIIRSLK